MLKEVIENHSLKVLNFDKCCKGKWTRVQIVNGVEVKSVLDYCLSSGEVVERLESMIIDEEKLFCPFRVMKIKKVAQPKYSDHNALLMVFKMSYRETRKSRTKAATGWKMTEDGLDKFLKLTSSEDTAHLREIYQYSELEESINDIMDSCFVR